MSHLARVLKRCSALAILACTIPAHAIAQNGWQPPSELASTTQLMTLDTQRNVVVAYDATTSLTSEWDGTRWRIEDAGGPAPGLDGAMAFVASTGLVLMFEAATGNTWSYDGSAWSTVATTGPGIRYGAKMVHDSGRDRVVLHGGDDSLSFTPITFTDTWEWDGAVWSQVSTTGPSIARYAMTYDIGRGHMLVYGGGVGFGSTVPRRDTWSWDGQTWTQLATTGPMGWRGSLAYEIFTGRSLLAVESPVFFLPGETWEWDGLTWTQKPMSFSSMNLFALVHHPVRQEFVGISSGVTLLYDGTSWTRWSEAVDGSRFATVAEDTLRRRIVAIERVGRTFEWDGSRWLAGPLGPALDTMAAAFDPNRGVVVVLAGQFSGFGELWEYNGTWTQRSTSLPFQLSGLAMATEPVTGQAMVFGGNNNNVLDGNTRLWDGTQWSTVASTGPTPRTVAAMATDRARGRVVLFGGATNSGDLADTWEWDGSSWSLVATSGPPARRLHVMAYDAQRRRVVMHGGVGSVGLDDVWEWDGQTWTQLPSPGPAQFRFKLAYSESEGRVLLLARENQQLVLDTVGVGCAGSVGVPSITLNEARPAPGDVLTMSVAALAPSVNVVLFVLGTEVLAPSLPLRSFGLPGCTLDVQPAASLIIGANGGSAQLSVSIPNDPALIGASLVVQGAAFEPGVNAAGLVLSPAAVAVVR